MTAFERGRGNHDKVCPKTARAPWPVTVDCREREAALAVLLRQTPDFAPVEQVLQSGDYVIADRVVVERKSFEDFAAVLSTIACSIRRRGWRGFDGGRSSSSKVHLRPATVVFILTRSKARSCRSLSRGASPSPSAKTRTNRC